jgi:hypothetical protein
MARESALWTRMKNGVKDLRFLGYPIDLQRLENEVAAGHPDVEGCIDGAQVWIELKSELRPVRATTPIHPKVRDSQRDWHRDRCKAGCRCNWVLLQVGEGSAASLYLIPGRHYEDIVATEATLQALSCVGPNDAMGRVLLTAALGW